MRIGAALLTAACVISGIVVIEAQSACAAGLTLPSDQTAANPQPAAAEPGPTREI